MQRTQIYLTEEQGRALRSRSRAMGCTVSELIRAAIDDTYGPRRAESTGERVRVARRAAGAWATFSETGAAYVKRVRGSQRLSEAARR